VRQRVRIGNGCGFWGDNLDAPVFLAETGRLDYLTLEYLAELTMSILAVQKQRDPQAGYASDFLDVLQRLTPVLSTQPDLKIITNAGGMNPLSCAVKARAILDKAGLSERRIATVGGDDLMPRLDELIQHGHVLTNLETNEPLALVRDRVVSANAYLGSRPIVDALKLGASVVITGRVADASLTVGPAAHEFGWSWQDWDHLAAATVAGHLIECGAQMTGGLWCNWQDMNYLDRLGYPIAELDAVGQLQVTKSPGGGAVNRETVSEQLLYEVGDPSRYLTPDVTADFSSVTLHETASDVVGILGTRGRPCTDTYKVSIAYRDGYTASGTLVVAGPQAVKKARACGQIILARLRQAGIELEHAHVDCLGAGDSLPGVLPETDNQPEVVLRVAVRDPRKPAVERFTKELAPLVTSGPPGITGYTGGRASVREVFAFWPALLDKSAVRAEVRAFP
jgi:hypothetical protein